MLPSFRLIVAAFLCGFVVVFAGLRLAATLHHVHASMPIAAAHAAPLPPDALAEPPGHRTAAPIVYDLRFVGGSSALASLPVRLTPPAPGGAQGLGSIDAALPQPLPRAERPNPWPAVAAIDPDVTTRATPDDPTPEPEAQPDQFDYPEAEPPIANAPEPDISPATATEPASPPSTPATKPKPDTDAEPAAAEAAPTIVTGSVTSAPAVPDMPGSATADDSATAPAAPTPEAVASPATNGAAATGGDPPSSQVAVPAPTPRTAQPAQRTAVKAAANKKRARAAQRAAQDPFGFPFSN